MRICDASLAFAVVLTATSCAPAGPGPFKEEPAPAEESSSTEPAGPPQESEAPPRAEATSGRADTLEAYDGPTDVEIRASDGLTLRGTFTPAQGGDGAAVLLLHMYGHDRDSWAPFAMEIAQSGISSLAIDLRGHGATGGAEDWLLAQQDTADGIAWLKGVAGLDPDRVGVAGASIGANLALVQAAEHPGSVAAVALLSPGLDYFRVEIDGLAEEIGGVPLFLAASNDDGYSAETVRTIADQASGEPTLKVFEGVAHGTDMFTANPELAESLSEFLRGALSR